MNINSVNSLWVLFLAVFVSAVTSTANEPQLAALSASALNYDTRISELEAELASLRRELQPVVGYEEAACVDCCDSAYSPGFYSGVAVVFAKPHFKEAFKFSLVNAVAQQRTLVPFSYDYSPTPRVWLGYGGGGGLGVRANYWQYDQNGDSTTVLSAPPTQIASVHATTIIFPATIIAGLDPAQPETLTATDGLETHIVNLEGTLHRDLGWISVVGAGGLRYAKLRQSLASTVVNAVGGTTGILNWNRNYEGIGPTVSVEAKRGIGCTGLSFIGSGGGALLFGNKSLDRLVEGDDTGLGVQRLLRLDDADEVVAIFEMRLGAEWTHTFASGAALSLGGTYEGQLWAEAGAPTLGFLGFEGFGIELALSL